MRLAAISIWLACVACGSPPTVVVVAPAPGACPKTTQGDLIAGSVSPAKLACMARDVRDHQDQLAQLVLGLDWGSSTNKVDPEAALARIPADGADWYGVAELAAAKDPRAGVGLYAIAAQRSTSPDVRIAASANQLQLAKALAGRDPASGAKAVDRARAQLVANASTGPLQKLQILQVLVAQDERGAIRDLCKETTEPALVWPCAEHDPEGLPQHLDGLASLSMLSFKDIERLRRIPASQSVLPGLQCAEGRWSFRAPEFINSANEARDVDPEPAIIYYRLRDGAPKREQQCLLERASIICLQLATAGKSCPVLSAFADYMRGLRTEEQDAVLNDVFRSKATFYRLRLLQSRTKEAEAVLFHLHLLLAEVLLGRPAPHERSRLPQFHVDRALQFWKRAPDPGLQFSDLLSEQVIDAVCRDAEATCAASCTRGFPGCMQACRSLSAAIASICPPP